MEGWIVPLLIVTGILIDICFIRAEYAGKLLKATVLKDIASLFFVLWGDICIVVI